MYSITEILAAAGIANEAWSKGGASARLTAANQLIGTYADLLKVVRGNSEYRGWEVHHTLEALDVDRLNLGPFSPAYDQQICVLIPAAAHHRINSILRRANPTKLTASTADLESAYRDAYNLVGNYCGSSEAAIAKELFDIFKAVARNLSNAANDALSEQLNKKRDELQKLQNRISLEKGLHEKLIRGSSPSPLQTAGVVASAINPITLGAALVSPANRAVIGGAVNALNPKPRPGLDIWEKAEASARLANQALTRRDLPQLLEALSKGEGHFRQADAQFTAWRDGIELAGRRAELAIGVAAAVATIIAIGVFALEATATTAAAGTAAATQTPTGVRVASQITEGVQRIVTASTVAEEQAGEALVKDGVAQLRMALPTPR
jgi:hypothetical protein